ncbi:MAG: transketolase family protein [Candidatus Pacebacteria bacterium]|nr:transketolase family protein [Candidatus Paceibacterota bacterium]MCF7856980.1 transketolase family protein [Candidatus Paceibacterota bacterium]
MSNTLLAQHVNPNLFNSDVETAPNRNGYGNGLKEAGELDERVVALSADLVGSTKTNIFAEAFPQRFIQVGIGEQSLASVASGMAAMGKIPFIASYAMFSPGRSWEQVRTTIAYNGSNVKIIGAHSGISVGPDGATHQAIEDIAIMRVIPRMVVIAPCDVHEAERATLAIAKYVGPVYMRLARENTPVITTIGSPFEIGKADIYLTRDKAHKKTVGIISTGTVTYQALVAGRTLNEKGIGASVMHMATIKPLDKAAVLAFAQEHDVIVTVEEHQRMGGLGSSVSEYLSEVFPKKILRMGVDDVFGQSGTPEELLAHYKIDNASIVEGAQKFLQ